MTASARYRIGALLGEGAVGTVWRAWDDVLQRDVALKMLKPAYAGDERTVARFYREARAAARLAHPNAVLVHDIVAERDRHAIVMEYVAGESLESVLRAEGSFGEARAVRVARQIALALAAAHACGLLHRDVKPANVLITQSGVVKVADFGLATAILQADPSTTEAGRLIGSAPYISPEQARGIPLTAASDLYSLGVVLHRLVTGRLPFGGANPIAIAVAHVTSPAPAESDLAREMSTPLAAIVARLLRKDPAERFGSAAELASALAALETAPRGVAACDAPTEAGSGVVFVPLPRSRGRGRRRIETAWRIVRGTTTGVAMAIAVISGVRVVSEHHVTVNGLRHLTLRHAAHTALVELGLRQRAKPAAPSDSLATVESDSGSAPPGN
ncbi:MAG TPA: serine/threonine-protein kinase [Candidatus Limnocylindrales bacterium]|nr:serine/threonine-protein kinase [Candidatus Limnocylindrales bacterium]